MKNKLPTALAILFGGLTLIGLLLVPTLGQHLLGWASFLAACALLLGLGNLFLVHSRRVFQANLYSLVLVLAMVVVVVLGFADSLGLTDGDTAQQLFQLVQKPLETAIASLLAFFLLFAGFRLLQQRPDKWSWLFLLTVLLLLLPLPLVAAQAIEPIRTFVSTVLVTSGLRGLLLGIALGTITLSLRLLLGSERPYSE